MMNNPYKPGSQLYRLLDYFVEHPMVWTAMPHLTRISGSYVIHSKIAELRRLQVGLFQNKVEHVSRDGQRVAISSYRFVPSCASQ